MNDGAHNVHSYIYEQSTAHRAAHKQHSVNMFTNNIHSSGSGSYNLLQLSLFHCYDRGAVLVVNRVIRPWNILAALF